MVDGRMRLRAAKRIVVKLGTRVVTDEEGELALGRLYGLVEDIAALRRAGREMLLVSSGAVGMGIRQLGLPQRPQSLGLRQACAAVGQGHLIGLYTQAFSQLGVTAAQVLLTQGDLADRDRALCLRTTLMRLLELGTLPILNENDSVSVRELIEHRGGGNESAFGDNDGLSALVAQAIDADVLVLLTDVGGLYSTNPADDAGATRIDAIVGVGDEDLERASGASESGTGGMASKLQAARVMTDTGGIAVIADGSCAGVVRRALEGEDVGTVVWPQAHRKRRHQMIAAGSSRRGALIANEGAIAALSQRKASLLPIGVLAVEGDFVRGDVVEIRDATGRVHGRGLVNYNARACAALAGHHSSEIDRILGFRGYDALVTRDNLVLGDVG